MRKTFLVERSRLFATACRCDGFITTDKVPSRSAAPLYERRRFTATAVDPGTHFLQSTSNAIFPTCLPRHDPSFFPLHDHPHSDTGDVRCMTNDIGRRSAAKSSTSLRARPRPPRYVRPMPSPEARFPDRQRRTFLHFDYLPGSTAQCSRYRSSIHGMRRQPSRSPQPHLAVESQPVQRPIRRYLNRPALDRPPSVPNRRSCQAPRAWACTLPRPRPGSG